MIRVVIGPRAICSCGCDFQWSITPANNIIYKPNKDQGVDIHIWCPRCQASLKTSELEPERQAA